MEPHRRGLPLVLDALGRDERDPAVHALLEAFGGEPASVAERSVDEPAYRSRRLLFSSGGELVLHDGAVAAVLLHFAPTPAAPRGLVPSDWIAGLPAGATVDELATALGGACRFADPRTPYFELDGRYARPRFEDDRDRNEAGGLLGLTVTAARPGLACRPEDDDCPACGDLLVREHAAGTGVDVDGTVHALAAALADGRLAEDTASVGIADLRPLHASGLMERVESRFTCAACARIICFTLFRDAPPTFGHHVLDEVARRPREAVPPVELWGDAERIARDRDALRCVDGEPGDWTLLERRGALYLLARYNYSSMLDDSALIRLGESELEAYRADGRDFIAKLARRVDASAPYRSDSPYHSRDLYRGPEGRGHRDEVAEAIAWRAWADTQPRPRRSERGGAR